MKQIVLIAHDIRSTYNVGSMLRTADGLGVRHVYMTGYTPYPNKINDIRLPHLAQKIDRQIAKVALGAERSVAWTYNEKIDSVISKLRRNGYSIVALEQTSGSVNLKTYKAPAKIALVVGSEIKGLEDNVIQLCDSVIEIPMSGKKESFNVAVAAAIGLSHLTM